MKRNMTHIAFLISLASIVFVTSRIMKEIDWVVLLALPFASSMAARAIAYLDIFDWLRKPFTKLTPHSSGVGGSVDPIGGPVRSVIGGLLSCINCAGMWSTVLLMALYAIDHNAGKITILCLGATGVGVLITRTIEMVEWKSCLAQEQTGEANRMNKIANISPLFVPTSRSKFLEDYYAEQPEALHQQAEVFTADS
jgi:hypothetical protein